MKIPLRYQLTRYDCGTESLLNALSYVFEREDLPADLVKLVLNYTIDQYGKDGHLGDGGTSREAMALLTHSITDYAEANKFGIHAQHLISNEATEEAIRHALTKHSAIVARVWFDVGHYVTVTHVDKDNIYLFDPYYVDARFFDDDNKVEAVDDQPMHYNRIVKIDRFFSHTKKNFSMGEPPKRELVIISQR